MPLRRVNARGNDDSQPPPVDPLNETVSHAEFQVSFQALAQAVTTNVQANNRATVADQQGGDVAVARIRDFIWMNPPEFYGTKADEDPQLYREEVRMITQVMYISE